MRIPIVLGIGLVLAALAIVVAVSRAPLVALAAKQHGVALATRDARTRGTYDAVGVEVIVIT